MSDRQRTKMVALVERRDTLRVAAGRELRAIERTVSTRLRKECVCGMHSAGWMMIDMKASVEVSWQANPMTRNSRALA